MLTPVKRDLLLLELLTLAVSLSPAAAVAAAEDEEEEEDDEEEDEEEDFDALVLEAWCLRAAFTDLKRVWSGATRRIAIWFPGVTLAVTVHPGKIPSSFIFATHAAASVSVCF